MHVTIIIFNASPLEVVIAPTHLNSILSSLWDYIGTYVPIVRGAALPLIIKKWYQFENKWYHIRIK